MFLIIILIYSYIVVKFDFYIKKLIINLYLNFIRIELRYYS